MTHAQHWMRSHTILQRLHAYAWSRTMGDKAPGMQPLERQQFAQALQEHETAVVIAQTMLRIAPAANDPRGQPCEA